MKFKRTIKQQDLAGVEKLLRDNLIPVRPRAEYVASLRQKLAEVRPEPPVLTRGWRTLIFSTAGVFSGLLIIGAAVRTVAGLILMVNLIRQNRLSRPRRAPSASPA